MPTGTAAVVDCVTDGSLGLSLEPAGEAVWDAVVAAGGVSAADVDVAGVVATD
ncbi:MAG: hypothetical protein JWP30_257, partial [Homoserinimonas sp.]|nr:hypothetical protein [Homoserinimonas sp.]